MQPRVAIHQERQLGKLRFDVGATTIRTVLLRHGVPPAPERSRQGSSRRTFLKHDQGQFLACDFFTVETLTPQTLTCLFFTEHGSRQVCFAGCTTHPNQRWVTRQARRFTRALEERELLMRDLIHDHDTRFTAAFDTLFEAIGVNIVNTLISRQTPMRSPNAGCAQCAENVWTA